MYIAPFYSNSDISMEYIKTYIYSLTFTEICSRFMCIECVCPKKVCNSCEDQTFVWCQWLWWRCVFATYLTRTLSYNTHMCIFRNCVLVYPHQRQHLPNIVHANNNPATKKTSNLLRVLWLSSVADILMRPRKTYACVWVICVYVFRGHRESASLRELKSPDRRRFRLDYCDCT